MQNTKSIIFKPSNSNFTAAEKIPKNKWIDTSFMRSDNAIGNLRTPYVNNGRYKKKHPVLDKNGIVVGYISRAADSIGYTWGCICINRRLWFVNQTFADCWGTGGGSSISIVNEVGTFLFSSTRKYDVVKTFSFERLWAQDMKVFKLFGDGKELLYLTNHGFALFNTSYPKIISHVSYPFHLVNNQFDFALSPKVKVLSIVGCAYGDNDPIDGEYRYNNFIQLYNMETGLLLGEETLKVKSLNSWTIEFSDDGRGIRVLSDSEVFQFTLETNF